MTTASEETLVGYYTFPLRMRKLFGQETGP
jgi:hypothetical protein